MGIQAPSEVKFKLIKEATRQDNNLLKISSLCEIAGYRDPDTTIGVLQKISDKAGTNQIGRILT